LRTSVTNKETASETHRLDIAAWMKIAVIIAALILSIWLEVITS